MAKRRSEQPGGAPIGSPKGGAPGAREGADPVDRGAARRTPTERERLREDPNANQAGNDRGSWDQVQGSQTGNDVDPVPE